MNILDYCSKSGKNIILSYVNQLLPAERLEIYAIREEIRKNGLNALEKINTRHIRGKLWEIKSKSNRIFYVVVNNDNIAFVHICKKEKNKAETKDVDLALKRMRKERLI